MTHGLTHGRLALAAVLAALGCTTPTSSTSTTSGPPPERATLEAFASTLSATGMSVGAPPRICVPGVDDVSAPRSCEPEWNDDVGCVVTSSASACTHEERAVLLPYSRALVRAHVKGTDDDGRGDALVDAWLRHDDARLKALALSVEVDFDAARLKTKRSTKTAAANHDKPKPKPVEKKGDVADAGPADVKTSSAAEPDASHGEERDGDAGPGAVSIKDRVVGTWTADEGPLRNIYAMCDTGDYVVRYEMTDDSLSEFSGGMPVVHGKWAAHDGDPPTLELSALGESMTATIGTLNDDTLEITLEGETVNLGRRSKSASCD